MQTTRADTNNIDLILDEPEFDRMYLDHYHALFQYAFTMLHDDIMAEEMVHLVFLKLLEKNGPIAIHTSLKAYLYRSVNNECLNFIKHQKVKRAFEVKAIKTMNSKTETPLGKFQYEELEQQLKNAISELPEQCRTIFQMSRFEELKYAEIANQLGLSIKTVETQMSRALKKLRIRLADYLPIIVWQLLLSLFYLIKH
ncbi:RNA polymerase sigma-70 factor [Pedobacter sp. L105]|uniref:RNA polymerase sigma-70 factor n=1 Tax=Pedobacter sp. L105 TaxID=1641871 RepID=UPI0020B10E73|nr:RNA polymerase sigma-70 factor [Pedobacter sp. L105]